MCGRFVRAMPSDEIASFFQASPPAVELDPNHNVAPTTDVYGVVADGDGRRQVEVFRWGLLPHWAKDRKIGASMINARSETASGKPAFKSALRKHRLLIPMDGYYEWRRPKDGEQDGKQAFFIHGHDGSPLAAAGIWATWHDPAAPAEAPLVCSCSILTTAASGALAAIHDRVPVFLPATTWTAWLDPQLGDLAEVDSLLRAATIDGLVFVPVSNAVNSVRNKGAALITPLASGDESPPPPTPTLFD